jgi:hypothetical protein
METPTAISPKRPLSRPRRMLFGITAVLLIVCAGLAAAEWLLRWRQLRIIKSDRLTPGLSRPDAQLGWLPTRHWTGRHEHHDFDVTYSINGTGFRGDDIRAHKPPAKSIAVVGDSFTFGTGVNDDETFVALLNQHRSGRERFYNFAVAGYSTDQELLLVEREVLRWKPDRLLLVVYLANDLFDNQLPLSLQVNRAKPMFILTNGVLFLTNIPASLSAERSRQPSLRDMVLGTGRAQQGLRMRLETRSYLARSFSEALLPAPDLSSGFDQRFDYGLSLFWALVERMRESCRTNGTEFTMALMSGHSLVENPRSLSAQYQEFFRRRIAAESSKRRVTVIDLASQLQQRYRQQGGKWFHPNEGHLNSAGHQVVAEILDQALPQTLPGHLIGLPAGTNALAR